MPADAKPRLLLVDDDAALCDALARGFAARGFDVTVAGTFAQAQNMIEVAAYEYGVIDLRLPDGAGTKLVSALKAADANTRIVVLTGYGSVPTAVDAIKRGASYYLVKPASVDAIVNAFDHEVQHEPVPVDSAPMSLRRVEWEHIQRVLHDNDGNVSAASRALSISRRTLQRKLAKHPARR
jgi:two-component system response regulator RegA